MEVIVFFKKKENRIKIEPYFKKNTNLSINDITDEELQVITNVALRMAAKSPVCDNVTENFLYGDDYKEVSANTKFNYLICTIGRLIKSELTKKHIENIIRERVS